MVIAYYKNFRKFKYNKKYTKQKSIQYQLI